MAGIGFRLKKYFKEGSFLGNIQGAMYSVIISSGPWLISVVTIAVISYYAQREIGTSDLYILKSIICYTFAVSLILFGMVEMPLTRYLADQLYKNDYSTFRSVFLYSVTAMLTFAIVTCHIFYSFFPTFSSNIILSCTTFFCSVLVIWLSMIFLSAAKNFHQITISFLVGGSLSVILAILLGREGQLEGYIMGYAIGQMIIAILLSLNIFHEFKTKNYVSFSFLSYFQKHRALIFVGLFYYLGIWVDKFVFWFGPLGEKVLELFYTNQYYDTAMFISYLSIVPSLAVFLVQVETNFYKAYSYYFNSIDNKNNLNVLEENIDDIIKSVQTGLYNLLKIQIAVTVLCWYFAEELLDFLYLPAMMLTMFKYGLIGAFLQVLFLIINIILLYFLDHKKVLFHYMIFFISNGLFSLFSTTLDFKYHGMGYLLSCLLTFVLSFLALNKHLSLINFYTFMGQPVGEKSK